MCGEKYLAIDVDGTSIKYAVSYEGGEIGRVNEIKTRRGEGELFNQLDEIIAPRVNDVNGIALSFPRKIDSKKGHRPHFRNVQVD